METCIVPSSPHPKKSDVFDFGSILQLKPLHGELLVWVSKLDAVWTALSQTKGLWVQTHSQLFACLLLPYLYFCLNESHRAWTLEYNWNAGVILISICHGKIEKQGENVEMNKLIHMQNVYNIVGVQFSSSKLIAFFFFIELLLISH